MTSQFSISIVSYDHFLWCDILGATAYFQMEKFDEALADCDKSIELNPKAIKVKIKTQ